MPQKQHKAISMDFLSLQNILGNIGRDKVILNTDIKTCYSYNKIKRLY